MEKYSYQENQWHKTKSSKLSKLQEINKRKKIIKRGKYVAQFKMSEVSLLIKVRSRMLNFLQRKIQRRRFMSVR